MLSAFAAAPLFHEHDSDDLGNPGSFVHAHFLEPEAPPLDATVAVEAQHSHDRAHWVDVFTLNTPVTVNFYGVAELSEPLPLPAPAVNRVVETVHSLHTQSS
jgi:hypothetical protein